MHWYIVLVHDNFAMFVLVSGLVHYGPCNFWDWLWTMNFSFLPCKDQHQGTAELYCSALVSLLISKLLLVSVH